jgi:hypothetical protein
VPRAYEPLNPALQCRSLHYRQCVYELHPSDDGASGLSSVLARLVLPALVSRWDGVAKHTELRVMGV